MKYTSIFDIVGPVMVGPSSSHTAGAVRIALLAQKIYGEKPAKIIFKLYNSFAKTGYGHGTDNGLVAGVLGFNVDDTRIKKAKELATKENIDFEFKMNDDPNRHPNSVDIEFYGKADMIVSGNSIGAGEVKIFKINDFQVELNGDLPTLLMVYKDRPGIISRVTGFIQETGINVATLNCDRKARGKEASMAICLDSILPENIIKKIRQLPDMYFVRNIEALKK
jgi:L-serine dehydratase